jgi:hypothetical protein
VSLALPLNVIEVPCVKLLLLAGAEIVTPGAVLPPLPVHEEGTANDSVMLIVQRGTTGQKRSETCRRRQIAMYRCGHVEWLIRVR